MAKDGKMEVDNWIDNLDLGIIDQHLFGKYQLAGFPEPQDIYLITSKDEKNKDGFLKIIGFSKLKKWLGITSKIAKEDLEILLKNSDFSKTLERCKEYNLHKKFRQLSLEETAIIHYYTSSGFKELNEMLAGKIGSNTFLKVFDETLYEALKKLPNYKGTVWRRQYLTPERLKYYKNNEGKTISKPVYLSTSSSKETVEAIYGNRNTLFVIESKTGKSINAISEYGEAFDDVDSEFEVLLLKGTNFLVKKVDEKAGIIYLIENGK